jgi:hypothetical protein
MQIELLSAETPNELEEFAAALELLGTVKVRVETRTLFLDPLPEHRGTAIKQLKILAAKKYCSWKELGQ